VGGGTGRISVGGDSGVHGLRLGFGLEGIHRRWFRGGRVGVAVWWGGEAPPRSREG
jgi:hypothetical protein